MIWGFCGFGVSLRTKGLRPAIFRRTCTTDARNTAARPVINFPCLQVGITAGLCCGSRKKNVLPQKDRGVVIKEYG